jgi:hypothetical protein
MNMRSPIHQVQEGLAVDSPKGPIGVIQNVFLADHGLRNGLPQG